MANPMDGGRPVWDFPAVVTVTGDYKNIYIWMKQTTQGSCSFCLKKKRFMICGLNIRTGNSGEAYFEKQTSTKISELYHLLREEFSKVLYTFSLVNSPFSSHTIVYQKWFFATSDLFANVKFVTDLYRDKLQSHHFPLLNISWFW